MSNEHLDSYRNAIKNFGKSECNITPFGGIKMVRSSLNGEQVNTIFPGVFYKDAVLSLISRANSERIFLYNQYSFEKAKQVFRIFDVDINLSVRPYLMKKQVSDRTERGLSVFFEQSIVPYRERERLFVIEKLISFAYREPNRKLVICTREYENSPHEPKVTFQEIITKHDLQLPKNLHITVGKSEDWLPRAEHVISITSSVLLDAIYNRKNVTVLELPKSAHYGQGLFFNSGLMSKDIVFPAGNVCKEWGELHVTPYIKDEHIEGDNKAVFDFNLNLKNIICIFKTNYLHFGKINKDFIRYSIKNMVFFHRYHQIYLEQQRSNVR
ncbi:hypothetical protein NB620_07255 [Vibrio alginolyticus]|uniref:DUF6716 putative glycosyltransferase n=1 Tax=Vibrio alginolyticus TaxID=663 RepID=UPI00215BCB29|nr:DUF6716 putative glycosyltransferase [Vibrio alginolyticus]MCS0000077.1 hypothetical protein [Vibrio alginolyticus]